ncbi:MAG: hypothetical protein IJQ12_02800 [Lachnospiraceae bacterium]|nr:hypothetical protein [Lachnospiraceae bacterium]
MKQKVIIILGILSSFTALVLYLVNLIVGELPRIAWGITALCMLISLLCMIYNYNCSRKEKETEAHRDH